MIFGKFPSEFSPATRCPRMTVHSIDSGSRLISLTQARIRVFLGLISFLAVIGRSQAIDAAEHIAASDAKSASAEERQSVTHHSLSLKGKPLNYQATAGTLTLRDESGHPIASMFYAAYTATDILQGSHRPITFLFNGGPGTASYFLHLGSFGPVRIATDSPAATHNPPYVAAPNEFTLLDQTDLVFLDAIGTGYSRALGELKDDHFWGADADVSAFSKGITRFLTISHRWDSPRFLFGESYGTARAAGVVYALQHLGVQFNGVVLLSSVLNQGIRDESFDRLYISLLPTYAATALYHHKVQPQGELAPFLNEVRAYAIGPYQRALDQGDLLPASEEDTVAKQLSEYTGLSTTFLKQNHLRVTVARFRKELLRTQHRMIGRYDTRVLGIDVDDSGEKPETDPSSMYVQGALVGGAIDYIENVLNYHTEMEYRSYSASAHNNWDWRHLAPGAVQVAPFPVFALDLAAAMRENPHLLVLSLNGAYDLATPFFQTEYDLSHGYVDSSLRDHLKMRYYPAGHMAYLDNTAIRMMKSDLDLFFQQSVAAIPQG